MDATTVNEQYLKIPKKFLLLSGLWPKQNHVEKYLLFCFIFFVSGTSLLTQSARVLREFSVDIILDQIPFFISVVLLIIKESNYILNAARLDSLLNNLYKDWRLERAEEELKIMKKYGRRGTLLASFYAVNGYICAFLFIQYPWSARLINSFTSHNITAAVVIPGYYFVDEEKFSTFIIFHGSLTVLVLLVVFFACDTTYMVLVQHACGLFAITGYRFKYAIQNDSSEKKDLKYWLNETYRNVRFSIQGHQHAIRFVKQIDEAHGRYFFFCLGIVIIAFSITLIRVSFSNSNLDFYRDMSFLLCQLMHLFIITLQGQFVINSCEKIHETMYESLWYKGSTKIQALYVLALRRNLTPPSLSAGGLIPLNMQCFSEVVKMSVSYYTVLKAT
ncbi:hypothetical protein ANTQUA_LOCUS9547 [Anthophora quadrimaculata]